VKSPQQNTEKTNEVSFANGTLYLLMLFLLSNVYEILYSQTISSRFDSVWAIYFFGSLLVVIPIIVLAARGGRALGRWASSMNLGVLLILVVTVATVLGTLVFQKRMPQEYVRAYGETLLNVFSVLHLVDVFHSVWFVNVLFVLIINILYCYISRREFTLRNLGGYMLHFGIVVSMIGAFIGFIYGVKGVIQLNEGDVVDAYVQRGGQGPPRVSLGYEIVLDDFAIEWYEPKYLVNTFRVTPQGGELVSSLNVEKKQGLKIAEAGISLDVVQFSENGRGDGLEFPDPAQQDIPAGQPPYPILSLTVENQTLSAKTRDEAKASGWLAAYDPGRNSFTDVFDTDADVLFHWRKPEGLTEILSGKDKAISGAGELRHMITYSIEGARKSLEVKINKAYRLEGTPFILRVTDYYPDFKIDQGKPYTSSDKPVNPALTVEVTDVDDPDTESGSIFLFGREEFRGMMHGGELPAGLELEYDLEGGTQEGETVVYVIGEEDSVYVISAGRLMSQSHVVPGTPVHFDASGHELLLSVQQLLLDQPLCELVVSEGGGEDTLLLSPIFSDPVRHGGGHFVSVFTRERDILDYKSRVRVLEDGEEILAQTIEVNHPLVYGGYAIYQQSYNEVDWTWTGFEVVRDPGLWVVYTGFIMMCIGSIYVFYVRPRIKKNRRS